MQPVSSTVSVESTPGGLGRQIVEDYEGKVTSWEANYQALDNYWAARLLAADTLLARHCSPPARCLDVGCAGGLFSELQHRRGHDVWGVDIAEGMVAAARRRLGARGVPSDHFRTCGGTTLPFEDGTFDVVSGFGLICYVEDQPAYIREIRRVLKPGGLAFVDNINRGSLAAFLYLFQVMRECSPYRRTFWRSASKLLRTGICSGGHVNLARAVQARSADTLDRFFTAAGFRVVDGFDTYRITRLDRQPLDRPGRAARAARRWAWCHFGLYARVDAP